MGYHIVEVPFDVPEKRMEFILKTSRAYLDSVEFLA